MKQILAGFLVVAMLVAGLMITPIKADAAETVVNGEQGVIYVLDSENYNYTTLWSNKTAPTREGYVFGGWYSKGSNDVFTAIKQSEGNTYTEAYAKFVPAEVLSVRAQLEATTEAANGKNVEKTYLRLLSGVNGLDYQKVGFDIYYNKKHHETNTDATNITKVYQTITNSETASQPIQASSIFGSAATHFSVLRLEDIYAANFNYVIYVTPQWTTLDGTLVEGQAKYVRVMDGYADYQYISVPINFFTGSEVAAGQLEMSYDSTKLEVVTVDGKGFDAGTLMTEMSHNDDGAGIIKIVGNIETAPTGEAVGVEPESNIYANVWFKVKSGVTIASGTVLEFTMGEYSFCDWSEKMVEDISAWDFKYLK